MPASPLVTREVKRELKRGPHQAHCENSDQGGRTHETSRRQGEPSAQAPKDVVSCYANPFESELRQEMRTMSHRIDRTLEDEA